MKKSVILCLVVSCMGCATETEPVPTPNEQATVIEEKPLSHLEKITLDMPRSEVEQLLGAPVSVKETATGSTLVWIFGKETVPKAVEKPGIDNSLLSKMGGIAAMTLGIFSPIAGTATSLGTQIFGVASSATETESNQTSNTTDTWEVTIEFRDNKAVSIQRTKSSGLSPTKH